MGATGQSRRDAPRPSPESAVRPATPRPTGAGVDAKPNSRCVASYVPVSAVCSAVPLTVSRNVLCSRPTRGLMTTPADTTQCDAHIDHAADAWAYAEERRLYTPCCVAWAGMACPAWRSARAMSAAAPRPLPRRTRRACCYLVHLGEACTCADSGRFGVRPSASLWAAQPYPFLFVMVWSAPPTSSATADLVQPLNAA